MTLTKKQLDASKRSAWAWVRSNFQGALYFSIAAGLCSLIWGFGLLPRALLVVAAIFALRLGWDLTEYWLLSRKRPSEQGQGGAMSALSDTFQRRSDPDREWYERVIDVGGQRVRVEIPPKVYEEALPAATALCREPEKLAAQFAAFKAAEAKRVQLDEDLAEQISGLEIETIVFADRASAEISFTEESNGELWTCVLVNGEFRDLMQGT